METFVGAAALALLGGISWLAFNHPRKYRIIYWGLNSVAAALGVGAMIWDAAIHNAFSGFLPLITSEPNFAKAGEVLDGLRAINGQRILISVGVLVYLGILRELPRLSEKKPPHIEG
jgi:hypothetical protein